MKSSHHKFSSHNSSQHKFDVAIISSGIAGSSLAAILARDSFW